MLQAHLPEQRIYISFQIGFLVQIFDISFLKLIQRLFNPISLLIRERLLKSVIFLLFLKMRFLTISFALIQCRTGTKSVKHRLYTTPSTTPSTAPLLPYHCYSNFQTLFIEKDHVYIFGLVSSLSRSIWVTSEDKFRIQSGFKVSEF